MAAKLLNVGYLAVLCIMVVVAPPVGEAVSCPEVQNRLIPCLKYLRSGAQLHGDCCTAVRNLNNSARTTKDRREVCICLKIAYEAYHGIDLGRAAGLPAACKVKVPYKISPSTDCNRIH